ncbi:MAG: hypothetical protein A2Y54_08155 [Chloroflexi bacterium RBG_16_51_16]|nr:MAG: hypothetical protein A2Y54_08155 [Chloroflexi bacterium RBG_16_51_16]
MLPGADVATKSKGRLYFPVHGWLGLILVAVFWILNWALPGMRTHWGFFPLWLGYCLAIDGVVFARTATSLLTRSQWKYVGLFLLSAPVWWLFEGLNLRTQNWIYIGAEQFSSLEYVFWTTLSFTTVMPAVFGTAELVGSTFIFRHNPKQIPNARGHGLVIRPDKPVTMGFFTLGWIMLILLMVWPQVFFPFVWISVFFIIEPVNIWLGNKSLTESTSQGDWRPIFALWLGVLMTAFFWEMWNYYSYPKWTYQVAWGDAFHLFEMPLLGYGGYLPFALELFALYHLFVGWFGGQKSRYIVLPSN